MRYRFKKEDINVQKDANGLKLSVVLDGCLRHRVYIGYTKKEAISKFQKDFGTYPDDYKPIGIYPLCNFGGIVVMEIQCGINDYVLVTDSYGNGYKNLTRNKLYYNAQGEDYFVRYGKRWYLHDFMKC